MFSFTSISEMLIFAGNSIADMMTYEQALFAAVLSLAGVIVILWTRIEAKAKETDAKLSDCEEDRLRLWEKLAEIAAKFGPNDKATFAFLTERDRKDH